MTDQSFADNACLWDRDSASYDLSPNAESEPVGMLAYALAYASRGKPVFPLHTPDIDGHCSCRRDCGRDCGKHPRTRNGLSDATTNTEEIRRWWSMWPLANIGIATGAPAGVFVLDVDATGGWESLESLQASYGPLPETPAVITGSAGAHLYFQHPGGRVSTTAGKLGRGLDIRGDGGYVVAPPSLHRSGQRYRWDADWHPNRLPYADSPAWLAALVTARSSVQRSATHYAEGASFAEGGRNSALTSLAGTMRRRGFSEDAILAALLIENDQRCNPPLASEEVSKIARSVARYPAPAPPVSFWRGVRIREVRRA